MSRTTLTEPLVRTPVAGAVPGPARPGSVQRWLRRIAHALSPLVLPILFLGVGEALIRGGVLVNDSLPAPSLVAQALFDDVQHSEVWSALGSTMAAWGIGLGAVIIVGVPIGALLGLNRASYAATQPTLEFIRTVPSIAALPLLILILGTSLRLAVVMVIAGALWPVLIQTMYGVRDVDPVAKDVGRVYGLRRDQVVGRIVMPSSLPYVATGIRLASLIALLLSVSATLIAGGQGIGYQIVQAMNAADAPLMYARIVLLGLAGVVVSLSVNVAERRLLHWHASQRKETT